MVLTFIDRHGPYRLPPYQLSDRPSLLRPVRHRDRASCRPCPSVSRRTQRPMGDPDDAEPHLDLQKANRSISFLSGTMTRSSPVHLRTSRGLKVRSPSSCQRGHRGERVRRSAGSRPCEPSASITCSSSRIASSIRCSTPTSSSATEAGLIAASGSRRHDRLFPRSTRQRRMFVTSSVVSSTSIDAPPEPRGVVRPDTTEKPPSSNPRSSHHQVEFEDALDVSMPPSGHLKLGAARCQLSHRPDRSLCAFLMSTNWDLTRHRSFPTGSRRCRRPVVGSQATISVRAELYGNWGCEHTPRNRKPAPLEWIALRRSRKGANSCR